MSSSEVSKQKFLIFVKKQSQELTRVNPDLNIFSINAELTSTFLLYRGLVHHRILNFPIPLYWKAVYQNLIIILINFKIERDITF